MLKKNLLAIALLLCISSVFGQEMRNCGTMEVDARLLTEDPGYALNQAQIEEFTQTYKSSETGATRTVITIPVVVHIVYNNASENISDAAVLSQIEILNEDFRKLNSDAGSVPALFSGVAADVEIEFCLASVDPDGNPTTGITRTSTSKTSFSSTDLMKYNTYGHAAWDRDSYLNMWSCDLSGGLLGYAQFPGGPAATDGVVIDYQYFGGPAYASYPFNLGRSATHEVGHWLNLRHIWGDASCGTDYVSDTPTHNTANYGCPNYPHYSTCSGSPVEMTMNYMDYVDDACMYMFSDGQKDRMQALFAPGGSRESLLSSEGCGGGATPTCDVPGSTSTTGITETEATLNWGSVSGAAGYNVRGRQVGTATWTEGYTTGTSINFTGLIADTDYEWQVQTDCGGGDLSAYTSSILFTTAGGAATCTDIQEPNNSAGAAGTISTGVTYNALIANSSDADYYKFTTSSPNTKIRVTMTSLPADYDMQLLNQKGKKKGISQNAGTSDETIVWNTNGAGTRYVYVYGYGGAFNTEDCYELIVEVSNSSWRTDGSELLIEQVWDNAIVNIFPNPASNTMQVNYFSVQETEITLNVYDLLGNQVQTLNSQVVQGENLIKLDVNTMAAGLYIVEINNGKSSYTEKFMVE
ncbi:MAG: T9SS type A sorting domain-containing protein [Chitinophagales bacterium]|nr:T9SS type A sorting domain-containing protein [Chitinophagales bacterium]